MAFIEGGKQKEFDDFTHIPNVSFKIMGYDFLGTARSVYQKWVFNALLCFSLASHFYNVYYMFKGIADWRHASTSVVVIIRYGTDVSYVLNSNVKFFTFVYNHKRIHAINDVFRIFYPKTHQERLRYCVNHYYWPKTIRYFIVLFYTSTAFLVYGPLIQSMYIYAVEANYPYLHAYPVEFGFAVNKFWSYLLAYLLETGHSIFMVVGNISTDLWIICFSIQIIMHFTYIASMLEQYEPRIEHVVQDCQFLVKLIQHHQNLLNLHNEFNSIFGIMLFYSYISTVAVLCTSLVYILLQGVNVEGVAYILFVGPAMVQFYIICYYGELLITKSQYVASAAYNHPWYQAHPAYKKLVLTLMVRAQKPSELSAKGFMSISLITFKVLMSVTYRVFTVLRNLIH